MKAHTVSLINALILITFGLWGYFGSLTPSITSLIPVFVGLILLVFFKGIRKENKIIAHIAVLLTLIILIGLFKPLNGALERSDTAAVVRLVIMILSTIVALVFFIKSFIDARKARNQPKIES